MSHPRAFALLLLLAACGSAEKVPAAFSGTISGAPFAAIDSTGFLVEPTACATLGAGMYAIAWVQFSTVGGTCSFALANGFCAERPSAVTVHVAIARGNLAGGPVAPIGPGTYDPSTNGLVDASGVVNWFWAGVDRTDPACAPLSVPKELMLDKLVLEEVGPARLRGSASAHAADGSALAGSFDVPICAASDAAFCNSLKGGCGGSTACVP